MTSRPYYTVQRTPQGAWAVVHQVPRVDTLAIDVECPSREAAERECCWLNAERSREQQRHAEERALCGVRA